MAVHPLRPATDRRLGRPLPYQLANRTRAHPEATGPEGSPPFQEPTCVGKSTCGITPGFPGLSPTSGQVTHALLTRSPLVYPRRGLTARLACVRHAASVHSEPGSNSPVEILTAPRRARRSCSLESLSLKLISVALLQQGTEVRQVLDPVFKEPAPVSGLILWGAARCLSSLAAQPAPSTRDRYHTERIGCCQPLALRNMGCRSSPRSRPAQTATRARVRARLRLRARIMNEAEGR